MREGAVGVTALERHRPLLSTSIAWCDSGEIQERIMNVEQRIGHLVCEAHDVDQEGFDELAENYKARIVSRITSPHRRSLAESLEVQELDLILPRLLEVYLELVERLGAVEGVANRDG